MTPVPVPVVNEVADAIAQALVDTRDENVAMWKDSEILKDVVAYLTEAVCESPQVRAAFEAQAKLEALLAGEGDLPEGWARQYRVVWANRLTPNSPIESAWSDNPDFVEVVREKNRPDRIERFEQSIRSAAVRVEEGGES